MKASLRQICIVILDNGGCRISSLVRPVYGFTHDQNYRKNERDELAKRYLKFDLSRLVEEAVNVCKGARHCMSLDSTMCILT
jgi:hypothetical protein